MSEVANGESTASDKTKTPASAKRKKVNHGKYRDSQYLLELRQFSLCLLQTFAHDVRLGPAMHALRQEKYWTPLSRRGERGQIEVAEEGARGNRHTTQ